MVHSLPISLRGTVSNMDQSKTNSIEDKVPSEDKDKDKAPSNNR